MIMCRKKKKLQQSIMMYDRRNGTIEDKGGGSRGGRHCSHLL
jgi:hypothetical protein